VLEITYVVQCLFLKDVDNNDPIRGEAKDGQSDTQKDKDETLEDMAGEGQRRWGTDCPEFCDAIEDANADSYNEGPQSSVHQDDTDEETMKVP